MFVLVILVGLSMDYHVFVLSRVREHVRRGLPARLAVEQGVTDTAGVVTSAAAVMVSVFAIFATLSMLEMKMMGVGLAVAILLDATLIRLVMLPAVLVLLGERAWWPQRPEVAARRGGRGGRPGLRPQRRADGDGHAAERGVARDVEALGVGQVVDRDPGHLGGLLHPGVAGVAVAVGEADDAGHHVVGRGDLDPHLADARGDRDDARRRSSDRCARSAGCMKSWWRALPRVSRSVLCIQELQSCLWRRPISSSSPSSGAVDLGQPLEVGEHQRRGEDEAVVAGLEPVGQQAGPQRAEVDARTGSRAACRRRHAGAAARQQQADQAGRAQGEASRAA